MSIAMLDYDAHGKGREQKKCIADVEAKTGDRSRDQRGDQPWWSCAAGGGKIQAKKLIPNKDNMQGSVSVRRRHKQRGTTGTGNRVMCVAACGRIKIH